MQREVLGLEGQVTPVVAVTLLHNEIGLHWVLNQERLQSPPSSPRRNVCQFLRALTLQHLFWDCKVILSSTSANVWRTDACTFPVNPNARLGFLTVGYTPACVSFENVVFQSSSLTQQNRLSPRGRVLQERGGAKFLTSDCCFQDA